MDFTFFLSITLTELKMSVAMAIKTELNTSPMMRNKTIPNLASTDFGVISPYL